MPAASSCEFRGEVLRGAGRACRPRPGRMPSSRDRKRASGISSCESGKKKMRLPGEVFAMAREGAAWRARAGRGDGVEAAGVHAAPFARPRCSQRGRAFGAERERRGEARRAASSSAARGVGEERLRQQERACSGRPPAARRSGAAAGSRPVRCRAPANRRRNWSSTTSASAPTTSSERPAPSARRRHAGTSEARQASSPCVKVVSMPLPE